MKSGIAANLALLAAVLALGSFVHFKPRGDEAREHALSALKPETVTTIRIERNGNEAIVLTRKEDAWFITAPLSVRADPFLVQRVLSFLRARATHRLAATELQRFDLERPRLRVAIDGESFGFGIVNEVSREQYVLAGGAVYTVNPRYGTTLPASPEELISRQLFAPGEFPVRIEIGNFTVAQGGGKWTATPAPVDVSQDDLARWVDEWRRAVALRVSPYGKDKPQGEIRVELGNGTRLTLGIIGRAPEFVLARPDERLQYHFLAESAKRLLSPPGTEQQKKP
jgi:hypothetical protein